MLSFTTFQHAFCNSKSYLFVIFLILSFTSMPVSAGADYFVDAHSQMDAGIDISTIESLMLQNNVRKTILSTRGPRISPVLTARSTSEQYFVDAIRTKTVLFYDEENSLEQFQSYFNNQAVNNSILFGAVQELLIYHAKKVRSNGDIAREVIVDLHSAKVQYVIEYCVSNNIPTIIHIEFASVPVEERDVYMGKLQQTLDQYPNHPFVLIHMGQLEILDVARLILFHDNIYFMTSHADPISVNSSTQPWTKMFNGRALAPEWRRILEFFPDRFIFAIDNVFSDHWLYQYEDKMKLWKNALNALPDDVANQFAHGNAERLWRLPVSP